MSRESLRTLLIVGLLLAAGSWAFLHYYEQVERERHFGYSPAARQNDYLAATRFLDAMGIPATAMPAPTPQSTLPERGQVLLMTSKRLSLDRASQQAVLDWVRAGGYLIISARTETVTDGLGDLFERFNEVDSASDRLFGELGIRLQYAELGDTDSAPTEVQFGSMPAPIEVEFALRPRLSVTSGELHSLAADDQGAFLLSGPLGDGHVSVIVDRRLLHNRRIGDYDAALLLWHLVNLYGPPAGVRVVASDDMPALPLWLWGHARELLIGLLLLVLLGLVVASRRFGPLRQLEPPQRRSLLEHLRASGAFQWRYHYSGRLLQAVRDDVRQQMSRKHPLTSGLEPARAAAHVSELVNMAEADIRRALGVDADAGNGNGNGSDPAGRMKPETYTETVRLLTELRKQL